jgi:hypothetical protein
MTRVKSIRTAGYPHRVHRSKKGRRPKYPLHNKNQRYREAMRKLREATFDGRFD